MSNKTNNLKAYLRDLYEGIVSKKPDASRNPQNFRSEIEAIRTGGELYEVMDASELPEDAPDGSLALVEGEPIPEAYTVSSVDELPSNAVDGSMAIVPSDSLIGEWEFHNEPKINEIASGHEDIATQYSFLFSCTADNRIVVFDIVVIRSYPDDDTYSMDFGSGGKLDAYPDVYWADEDGWGNENSKRINIMSNIEDVTFAEWLPQNAKRLSGGYSLYTHENGQWVYKCEVV